MATGQISKRNSWQRFRRILHRGRPPAWAGEIEDVAAGLARMNQATEADFLAIAGNLTGLLTAARTISEATRAAADSLAGAAGEKVCQALTMVLDQVRGKSSQPGARSGLNRVHDSIAPIRRSLAGFERVAPLLHVMATLAQIETAHLGSARTDLSHLAGEFRGAGEDIRVRVESIREGTAALEARIAAALREAAELDEGSLQARPALLAAAERGLGDFSNRQREGAQVIEDLARQSDLLAAAMGDIVASVQFHDITRQQVEHVIDSLAQLREDPDARPAVLGLQIAQLKNAAAEFVQAARSMDQRLEAVVGQIQAMVAESGKLLGSAENRETSFYAQMETSFRAIAETEGSCTILDQRTESAILDLQQTVEGFEESAREIHRVELRLRRLTINAAISAAHVGAQGEPLEAVASAMQQLLTDCEAASEQVDTNIRSIAETIGLAVGNGSGLETDGAEAIGDQLQMQIAELHRLGEQAAGASGAVGALVAELARDLAALREGFSAERIFSATTEECCQVLGRIRARAGGRHATDGQDTLGEFSGRYTMQAERAVHQTVAGAGETAANAAAGPGEFGENVELF